MVIICIYFIVCLKHIVISMYEKKNPQRLVISMCCEIALRLG